MQGDGQYTSKELRRVILDFIKYFIRFFWAAKRREKQEEKRRNRTFDETVKDLKNGYNKIDNIKKDDKNKSEKERLDNLF